MPPEKFFHNPFEDYTSGDTLMLPSGELKKDLKIVRGLEQKWKLTISSLRNLDLRDYSVYTGTAGIALLKLKFDSESRQNLEEVRELLSLNRLRCKRQTFLCGDGGPLAIGAVVDFNLENVTYLDHIKALQLMSPDILNPKSEVPNEYLYGRAGYLYAVLYVNKYVSPAPFDEIFIRNIIEVMFICGRDEAKTGKFKSPLMYQWHDSYYLGAAHGLSGILYLLLQIKQYLTETELNTLVKPTIDYLATLKFPSGNFPSSVGRETDKLVQWCHGAPGFVFLFCTAYKVFGSENYLKLALDCGDVIWQRGLCRKGYSLCHGVSGNAYSFLALYQTTRDEKHLYRAVKFAEWCLDYDKKYEEHSPDRPNSLYEGIGGPMYLLLDIQRPLEAKLPGFSL